MVAASEFMTFFVLRVGGLLRRWCVGAAEQLLKTSRGRIGWVSDPEICGFGFGPGPRFESGLGLLGFILLFIMLCFSLSITNNFLVLGTKCTQCAIDVLAPLE